MISEKKQSFNWQLQVIKLTTQSVDQPINMKTSQ
jgi:hypothetical protein